MSLKDDLMQLIFKYGLDAIKSTLDEANISVMERVKELHVSEEPVLEEPALEEPALEEPALEIQPQPQPKGKNEKKKAQREAERLKREANAAEGIFPEQLLTEDNLRKWNKHSCAYIAREFVGCREEEVAKALKKFNITKTN